MTNLTRIWQISPRESLALDRPVIMGILNITPDSFSDGGKYHNAVDRAVAHANDMIESGATIIDVGGESTRPGAESVAANEQIDRTVPVIEQLRRLQPDVVISIDTTLASVAAAALDAGATIINDVSAGRDDDEAMFQLAADRGCGLILMHRRVLPGSDSFSDEYESPPVYEDVVDEVSEFLQSRIDAASAVGVAKEQIVIDPGLGFGKSVEQNYELIRRIDALLNLGCPVLCAASRKSFIGAVTGVEQPSERVNGSVAVSVVMFESGCQLFRVHDIAAHRQALEVAVSIRGESSHDG